MLTPRELFRRFPLRHSAQIQKFRNEIRSLVHGKSNRIAIIVGPCSLHNTEEVLEYARRLKTLSDQIQDRALIVMRAYFEKPRTTVGWKGLVYDPDLDGTHNLEKGLLATRALLLQLSELGLPLAAEFLDPNIAPYLSDLISWGVIGSRSCTSQIHRQLASNLPLPVGIKHGTEGSLDCALNAMIAAGSSHHFFGIDEQGVLSAQSSHGNPDTHLIMRGSRHGPNFEADAIAEAHSLLQKRNLQNRLLIDCSHGNSGKDHTKQPEVFANIMKQIRGGNRQILGVMLESHLHEGKKLSLTDSCIGWETTEKLLLNEFHPHLLTPVS
ncbi:MAG: 3-deoxy-7-phosphoheptulonate synthase [Candidatus Algichlamydia australiensis]|nr:3-deoxy-7-phosphoheptulonate synthase [Chlamydiales bacterium]